MRQSIEAVLGPWSEGSGPLHRKLSDALRAAIADGRLAPGHRLPSERDLAGRLAVSRSTVVAAYDTLRGEAVIESRQGSGTRVHGTAAHGAGAGAVTLSPVYRTLVNGRHDLISLAAATFPAHPQVAVATAEVLGEDGDKLLAHTGYLPAGLPALREALADRLTMLGTPTTADQVLVTTGAQQAVHLAAHMLVRPGDEVVVEAPSFSGTIQVVLSRGATLRAVPVDEEGVDVHGVARVLAAGRPAAIYLMPSFHNPTGALLAANRRRDLAELVVGHGVPLIEDNALENTPLDDDRLPPISAYAPPDAPVLTVGSFSKVAWGGLRVGWVRGPVPTITRLAELKAMNDLGSPLIDQAIAARLVPHLDEMRADHRDVLNRNLALVGEMLHELLPGWTWRRPKGGPSLWVELPSGGASAFTQVAMRYGVEVIPGDQMSPTGDEQRRLRLPYTAEPTVLAETIRRLAAAWDAYAPSDERQASTPRPVVV